MGIGTAREVSAKITDSVRRGKERKKTQTQLSYVDIACETKRAYCNTAKKNANTCTDSA